MLIDRPQIVEGSVIENATVPSGTVFPSDPSVGELFFHTGLGQLHTYNASAAWESVPTGTQFDNHLADSALHLSSAQNTLLDNLNASVTELNYLVGVTAPIQTQLNNAGSDFGTHTTDMDLHLTADQNTFLDGLNLPTLTASDVNAVPAHIASTALHLSADERTFLSAINLPTITGADVNSIPTIQSDLSTLDGTVSTHIADTDVHLTSAQNSLLDALNASAVELNYLVGTTSSVQSQLNTLTSSKVSKSGDTMTGNLVMSGATVTGLPIPSADSDAANKAYVDALAGGIDWKQAVVAATTGPITLSGAQTIDGVSVVHNDRVLVKDQASTSTNGIYLVNGSGAWSRAPDYDTALKVSQSAVYVLPGGPSNGRGSFVMSSTITTLNTDPIVFTPFSGPVINSSGNGIDLAVSGLVSVKEGAGITFDGSSNVAVDLFTGGGLMTTVDGTASSTATGAQLSLTKVGAAGTYVSVTTDAYGRVTSGSTTQAWSTITGTPTTRSGYGITDAQPLDATLTALAAYNTTGFLVQSAPDFFVGRSIAVSGIGLSITDANGANANPTITSNATSNNATSTLVARDSVGNFSAGTITATLSGTATNATQLGGLSLQSSGSAPGANQVLRSDASGYTYTSYINSNTGNGENPTISQIIVTNGSDGFYRKASIGHVATNIGAQSVISTGGWNFLSGSAVGTAGQAGTLTAYGNASGTNAATMSFHRPGAYAINVGLDTDNVFRIGGWSDGASTYRLQSYASGSLRIGGALYTTNGSNYLQESSGSYGTFEVNGTKGGYGGLYIASGLTYTMYDTSGNGGAYGTDGAWQYYWNRANACLGLGGSTTAASYKAYTNGNHYVAGALYATGEITAFSDARIKKNVEVIPDALSKVEQIRGVTFERTDEETGTRYAGVIAQEVEAVLPEVIREDHTGTKTVAYGNIVGLLIEAIKELNQEVNTLREEVKSLKGLA